MIPAFTPASSSLRDPITTVAADDSPAMLSALRRLLETHSRIELLGLAPDGREAVEIVARLRPRLVLLDFQMPRLNGLSAAREIRQQSPATRIIIMSAHRATGLDKVSRQCGADAFVEKANLAAALPSLIEEWFA